MNTVTQQQQVKKSNRKKFDWSIIGDMDRKNVFLCYPSIVEPKSYFPGSENIPASLEVVTTRYSVAGLYNPSTNMIQVGVSRISHQDNHCYVEGRKYAIERAQKSFIYITVPAGLNPAKFFKDVCGGFCHIKFVEMQKNTNLTNQTEQNANLTNERPVEPVPVIEEFSESQIH